MVESMEFKKNEKGLHVLQKIVRFTTPTEKVYFDLVTGYMLREGNALMVEITEEEYKVLVELENPLDRIDFAVDIAMLRNEQINIQVNNDLPEFGA